jgi:predicted Zn finger-like uncharacterized protein
MDVRCERCQTEYEVEDASVSDLGTEVQCSDCGHLFVVKRSENAARQANAIRNSDGPDAGEWVIETVAGQTHHLRDLTMLHKWIIERRVTRDDRILRNGEPWQRLGDMAELTPFFDIVDSAERARTDTTSSPSAKPLASSGIKPSTVMPPTVMPPMAMAQGPERSSHERRSHKTPSTPLRRLAPVAPTASAQGAFPIPTDTGHTVIIKLAPRKARGVLKLFLTMLVAAVVAYAGILVQQYRSRSAMISSSGTTEDGIQLKIPTEQVVVPPAPPPAQNSEAAEAPVESDTAPARGPVVEPIAELDHTHLLGKGSGKAGQGKSKGAHKGKSAAAPRTPAATASVAKDNTPAPAIAAQGYGALNHRQYPEAIVLFKQALAGSPSNGTAIFGLAEAYRGSGQTALALKSYRHYVRILPFGPDAGSARFQIQSLQGKRR